MKKLTVRELADRFNQKRKDEGKFWYKPKDDKTQIIFVKDNLKTKKLCGSVSEDVDGFNIDCIGTKIDKSSQSWYTHQVLTVGQKGLCSSKDLSFFLPNFPTIRGSELYFFINSKDVSDALLPDLIRGCHLIEMKYREDTGYENGFGSPSKTRYLIDKLMKINKNEAIDLYNWVAANGGSHGIDKDISYDKK